MQGFLLLEMSQKAIDDLHDWVSSGDLVVLENVTRGIDNAGEAFSHLMAGSTVGKTLIELDLPEAAEHVRRRRSRRPRRGPGTTGARGARSGLRRRRAPWFSSDLPHSLAHCAL